MRRFLFPCLAACAISLSPLSALAQDADNEAIAPERPSWSAPIQDNLQEPVPLRGAVGPSEARLWAKARFDATVQILSIAHYAGDWEGGLAPVDLAIGWGPMFERVAIDTVQITQDDRFYFWKVPGEEPWTAKMVAEHSANVHIIPANSSVLAQVRSLRPGDQVRLQGLLVDAEKPNGQFWFTSMTRTDTGPGACEIFLLIGITKV